MNRLVTKSEWLNRWPNEPSYLKVLESKPKMDRVSMNIIILFVLYMHLISTYVNVMNVQWLRHGHIIGSWVLRSQPIGVYKFTRDLDRADWLLIHKHDEHKYTDAAVSKQHTFGLRRPARLPLPVLQRHILEVYIHSFAYILITIRYCVYSVIMSQFHPKAYLMNINWT